MVKVFRVNILYYVVCSSIKLECSITLLQSFKQKKAEWSFTYIIKPSENGLIIIFENQFQRQKCLQYMKVWQKLPSFIFIFHANLQATQVGQQCMYNGNESCVTNSMSCQRIVILFLMSLYFGYIQKVMCPVLCVLASRLLIYSNKKKKKKAEAYRLICLTINPYIYNNPHKQNSNLFIFEKGKLYLYLLYDVLLCHILYSKLSCRIVDIAATWLHLQSLVT